MSGHHVACAKNKVFDSVSAKCTCDALREGDEKAHAERDPGAITQIAIHQLNPGDDAPPIIYAITESGELWSLDWEIITGGYKQHWQIIPGPTAKDRK